jgi:hypothetical protein
MKTSIAFLIAVACAVALIGAGTAMADNPTQSVYGPEPCSSSSSSLLCNNVPHNKHLPFTGIDVVPLALLGAGLLGAGVVARRRLTRGSR